MTPPEVQDTTGAIKRNKLETFAMGTIIVILALIPLTVVCLFVFMGFMGTLHGTS